VPRRQYYVNCGVGPCYTPFAQVFADSEDFSGDSESFQTIVNVEFTNGPVGISGGDFVPCLAATAISIGGGSASAIATFGGVQVFRSGFGSPYSASTCGNTNDFVAGNLIPFTFGVVGNYALSLSAGAIGSRHGAGQANASFNGVHVFDAFGNPLPATVTIATPETDLPWAVAVGILSCWGVSRRRNRV
jgi:hypothetical protein